MDLMFRQRCSRGKSITLLDSGSWVILEPLFDTSLPVINRATSDKVERL